MPFYAARMSLFNLGFFNRSDIMDHRGYLGVLGTEAGAQHLSPHYRLQAAEDRTTHPTAYLWNAIHDQRRRCILTSVYNGAQQNLSYDAVC